MKHSMIGLAMLGAAFGAGVAPAFADGPLPNLLFRTNPSFYSVECPGTDGDVCACEPGDHAVGGGASCEFISVTPLTVSMPVCGDGAAGCNAWHAKCAEGLPLVLIVHCLALPDGGGEGSLPKPPVPVPLP